jgi:hypothetical protein
MCLGGAASGSPRPGSPSTDGVFVKFPAIEGRYPDPVNSGTSGGGSRIGLFCLGEG